MTRKEAIWELVRRAEECNLCIPTPTLCQDGGRPWMFTQDHNTQKLQEIKDALGAGFISTGQGSKVPNKPPLLIFRDDEFEPVGRELLPLLAKGKEQARRRYTYLADALNRARFLRMCKAS